MMFILLFVGIFGGFMAFLIPSMVKTNIERRMAYYGIGVLIIIGGGVAGIGLSSSSDAPNGSPSWVIGGTVLLIIGIVCLIYLVVSGRRKEKADLQKLKNKGELRKDYSTFLTSHSEIKHLKAKADKIKNDCVTYASFGLLGSPVFKPQEPTYTRGLYKGSIGDNLSVLANAQKKADYEKNMASYNKGMVEKAGNLSKARSYADAYYKAEDEVIEALKKIPGGEKFVSLEEEDKKQIADLLNKK